MKSNEILNAFGIKTTLPARPLRNDKEIIDLIKHCISLLDIFKSEFGEWTPTKERPPKENGRYLVSLTGDYIGCLSYAKKLSKADPFEFRGKNHAGWYDYDGEYGNYERFDVVAWMPLPKAYTESEAER